MLAASMLEGLPPNSAAHVMRLSCDEAEARRIADLIVESFDPAMAAAAAFEEAPEEGRAGESPWAVEAYFGAPPDEGEVRALIALAAGEALAKAAIFETLNARDWVAASLEGLKPVRTMRFLIHGAHHRVGFWWRCGL